MRHKQDSRLKMWAREVRQHLAQDNPVAYLVLHGDASSAPASAHTEDTHSVHLLGLDEVVADDVIRLGQLLPEEGVAEVTVNQGEVPA